MLYNPSQPGTIDLTKFEGKLIVEVNARNEMDNDDWSLADHHGKEGVWYKDGGFEHETIELESFKTDISGTKFYELHVKPSASEHQIIRHKWLVRYWVSTLDLSEIKSTTIKIIEYYNEPWEFIADGACIKGIILNENTIANIHNS